MRCSIPVVKDQVLKLQVTGVADTDSGAFTLRILSLLPGSSVAVAKDLGSAVMVSTSGDSTGFADSLPPSQCGAAGSVVVSAESRCCLLLPQPSLHKRKHACVCLLPSPTPSPAAAHCFS